MKVVLGLTINKLVILINANAQLILNIQIPS
ncbi:uncharacterized protein METZ01_LOCUS165800 [marine metagenome]|uniref:Uncharacterized protein n=1 Tax=marine metagenome TaxID=408172 RepID=A0A382BGK0_9ZZZZ